MKTLIRMALLCAGSLLPASAATYSVLAGQSLQAALNLALPGDTVTIQAGATFVGNFVLPNKGGTGTITLRSSAMANLPAGRVSPADAANMPKLVTPNSAAALAAAVGAHDYVIEGLEMTAAANIYAWTIVQLGDGTETTVGVLPYNITVDRCYVHGDPAAGGKRGIGLNSRSTSVLNSWVSDFKSTNQDTQGVGGINGPGPFQIINNQIEATGENIMFGGGTPAIPGLIPSDITIRKNTLSKPLSWKPGMPGYKGTRWLIKNLFELKNGQRVYLDGNILENCWASGQNGTAIVLTVSTESGRTPWAVVQDVHITNNLIRHMGVGIAAHNRDALGGVGQRFFIKNNIFEDIDPVIWGGTGTFMLLSGPVSGVVVEHNTIFPPRYAIYFGSSVSPGIIYRNNISTATFCADSLGCGNAAIVASGSAAVFQGNLLIGLSASSNPAGNWFPAATSAVGFIDAVASDYTLSASSSYRRLATDGKDSGVDMIALRTALGGGSGQSPTAKASFVQADVTTRGNWKGVYGADGFAIPYDSVSNPPYLNGDVTGHTMFVWAANTADTRAPQKGVATGRIASTWYSSTAFDLNVNLTDSKSHRIALYMLDYDNFERRQRVDIIDKASGVVLNTQSVSAFQNGTYLVWNITGNVILRVYNTGPRNAVVSGIFVQ